MEVQSLIKIQDHEDWLEAIEFKKIREKEKYLLRKVKDKLDIVLNNIRKNDIEFWDEIKFGQFIFYYCVSKYGKIKICIHLYQQSAAGVTFLDEDQWTSYLYLLPHQVFYPEDEYYFPVVRRLSDWDELQRIEDWINNELKDWVLNKYNQKLQEEGMED